MLTDIFDTIANIFEAIIFIVDWLTSNVGVVFRFLQISLSAFTVPTYLLGMFPGWIGVGLSLFFGIMCLKFLLSFIPFVGGN